MEAETSDLQKSESRLLDQLREEEYKVRILKRRAILALKRAGVPVGDIAEDLLLSRDEVLGIYLYSKDSKDRKGDK